MDKSNTSSRARVPTLEACEERVLTTLVFVLNGNAFGAAGPNNLTTRPVQVLRQAGSQAVQVAYSTMATPAAFTRLVQRIETLSHGQTIGIVGFSGGDAGVADCHRQGAARGSRPQLLWSSGPQRLHPLPQVRQVLAIYPAQHHHPGDDQPAERADRHRRSTSVSAFGRTDPNVIAAQSIASLKRDFPQASTYTYAGAHRCRDQRLPACSQRVPGESLTVDAHSYLFQRARITLVPAVGLGEEIMGVRGRR